MDGLDGQEISFNLLDNEGNSLGIATAIGQGDEAQVIFTLANTQDSVGERIRVRAEYSDNEAMGTNFSVNSIFHEVTNVDDLG